VTAYDQKMPIRNTFAGIGNIYDPESEEFRPASPHPNWVWNSLFKAWEPPVPKPETSAGQLAEWNEQLNRWQIIEVDQDDTFAKAEVGDAIAIQHGSKVVEYFKSKKYPHLHETAAFPNRYFDLSDGSYYEEFMIEDFDQKPELIRVGPKLEAIPLDEEALLKDVPPDEDMSHLEEPLESA